MKLHYMKTMNPRKACATAKYLRLPVEYVPIDFSKGGLRSPEFLALNPNGRAPVLEDDGKTIWESVAIMIHLANKAESELWPAHDLRKQVEVMRWVSWDAFHFAPHAGAFYFEYFVKPALGLGETNPAALESTAPQLERSAAVLDAHLAQQPFLVGNALTIADFCVGVLLPTAEETHLPLAGYENIQRWHGRLMELDAWRNPWPE
jgi:glutathione S-transferase